MPVVLSAHALPLSGMQVELLDDGTSVPWLRLTRRRLLRPPARTALPLAPEQVDRFRASSEVLRPGTLLGVHRGRRRGRAWTVAHGTVPALGQRVQVRFGADLLVSAAVVGDLVWAAEAPGHVRDVAVEL